MNRLPDTPAEAQAIELTSMGVGALYECLNQIPDPDARKGMAKLIADMGRKYTPEAREEARRIANG